MTLRATDSFSWALQSTATALTYGTPQSFEATDSGNAYSFEASTLASGFGANSNDDLVGYWVEVVSCANAGGRERGAPLRRPIVAYNNTTKVVTIFALPFSVASGDQFRLLKAPHKWLSEDTGGSASLISDADRNEADDALNGTTEESGYYVEVVKDGGDVAATDHPRALNWTNSTHDLSTASALSGSTTVGDLFELWKYPEVDSLIELRQPRLDHAPVTGTIGKPGGMAGIRDGDGNQSIPFRGPGSSRVGDAAEIDVAFAAVMSTVGVSDCTADSGGSTSSVTYSAGSPSVGEAFITEAGDVFVCTADSGSAMTPSPSLRDACVSGQTIYGGRKYTPAEALQAAVAMKQWRGKEICEYAWGAAPSLQIQLARNEVPKVALGWQVPSHSGPLHLDETGTALSRAVRPIRSSVNPRALGATRVNIGGTDFEVRSANIDLGLTYTAKTNLSAPDGTDGFALSGDAPILTIEGWIDADTKLALHDFVEGEEQTVLIQSGQGYGDPGVVAFWAYKCEYTGTPFGDDGGVGTVQLTMRVVEDRTEATLPRWLLTYF